MKRNIRIVVHYPASGGHKIYLSTDLSMSGKDIFEYYRTRFQIEFCFRDSKQFTELNHCQARDLRKLLLRLSVSRNLVVRLKTGLWMDPSRFDKGVFSLPKDPTARADIRAIEDRLIDIERFLINLCEKTPADTLTKDFVAAQYDLFLHPKPGKQKRQPREPSLFYIFEDYIEKKNISEWRSKHLRVLKRALMRFELYVRANGRSR